MAPRLQSFGRMPLILRTLAWLFVYFVMANAWADAASFWQSGDADFYAVLGIGRDASQGEIRSAFIQRIRIFRPDQPVTEAKARVLIAAYEALSKYRAVYDHWLQANSAAVPDPELAKLIFAVGSANAKELYEILVNGHYLPLDRPPGLSTCEAALIRRNDYRVKR